MWSARSGGFPRTNDIDIDIDERRKIIVAPAEGERNTRRQGLTNTKAPKSTDLTVHSAAHLIARRCGTQRQAPRKTLGWNTPALRTRRRCRESGRSPRRGR